MDRAAFELDSLGLLIEAKGELDPAKAAKPPDGLA